MNADLHIAIVIASMRTGGAERAMLNLANGLQQKGVEVDLVLVERTGELLKHINDGVNIHDLGKKHAGSGVFAFRKYLSMNSPDAIIAVQTHVQLMSLIAAKISGWNGKIILNEQSTFSSNTKSFLVKSLASFFFRRADAVTAVSQGAANDFAKEFPSVKDKTSVIFNPVFSDEILKLKNENVEHTFMDKKFPVILSAGRLTLSKNYKLLLDAFAIVLKKVESRLIIIGEGEERSSLESHAAQLGISASVSFPGSMNNPFAYMSRCDVFVLTSDYEGLPSVLIEALACGCRIVSTDCPNGPPEILENGKYGTLVPVNNPPVLAEEIIKSFQSKSDPVANLNRARDFSIVNISEKYLGLIRKLKQVE